MDPRFSFSKSYPVQHPVWTEAIRNSKVDHSIEPIGKALAMLYGNIPKPKQISVQSRWHHGGGKIDEYVLNSLCDFTVRVSLLSKELTKADYTQLLEWIYALRTQYQLENLTHFSRGDGFKYILRGQYNKHFHDYILLFAADYGYPVKEEQLEKEFSYQDAFDVYRYWRIGTFRGDLRGAWAESVKKWVDFLTKEVELFPISAEWARYSFNEPDLASLLKSLDVAHFDGAASVSESATSQAEAKDNVEVEQSERLTFVQPSSTAQAKAEDSDEESIDSIPFRKRPRRWSMRVFRRKHERMLESMSV